MKLIPITYHEKKYPFYIVSQIDEIAGHLDKEEITVKRKYSLHTEYSHMNRKLNSEKLIKYPMLRAAQKNGVPRLWYNKNWAEEFAGFIVELISLNRAPEIIEIHPPFNDYCQDFDEFFKTYEEFEKIISKMYPNTKIFIENRCGTFYTGGSFLLSNAQSIVEFLKELSKRKLKLKMVLDYPQVFSAEKIKMDDIKLEKILAFNKEIKPYINWIGGFHLWGKRKNTKDFKWNPHTGNLNTFFSYDTNLKQEFLNSILETFDDNEERYFVPEVNSSEEDLQSIIADLINTGFEFPMKEPEESNYDYKMIQDVIWQDKKMFFNIYDSKNRKESLIPVEGISTIKKGLHRRCTGYKDLTICQHQNCPNHTIIEENMTQCISCKNKDVFSYCVMCKGEKCRNNSQEAQNYCNQEHYTYLAYFSQDKIKVGTLFHQRITSRLEEQGAFYALRIAKAPTGKIARMIEHEIVNLGYAESVSSSYKANHILIDNDKETIIKILNDNYNKIKEKLPNELSKYLISPEEYDDLPKANELKEILSKGSYAQQTLFGNSTLTFEIDKISPFIENIPIIGGMGYLIFLKNGNKNYYFNIKDLIGYEIEEIK